jgi:CheY-like chemotaxis protein
LTGERGQVPIVALTAQAFAEQVAECRKAGMNSHISKPFDPETLLTAVMRATAFDAMKEATGARTVSLPANVAVPMVGSELLVFNPAAFERTAHYLAPEAVAAYLDIIAEQGETLLLGLRKPDALTEIGEELADAAHAIAGSAGLLGFERLTVVGRRFERAVHAGAAEAPTLADGLSSALESTLQALQDRTLTTADV